MKPVSGNARLHNGDDQYSLAKIMLIWVAATAPMGFLAWIVWPWLKMRVDIHPGMLFWMLMVIGMVWQCVLSLIVLRRELGTLRWSALAPRIWAQNPRDPHTGKRQPKLWWMLVPIVIVFLAITYGCELLTPFFETLGWIAPAGTEVRELADPMFVGQWWILVVALVSCAFNYVLGEELLFRGVLLPKMAGVFGRWDWLANTVLFSLYHVHKIWNLPTILLTSIPFSWSARRYRTIWFSIILHSIEGLILLVLVTGVVTGVVF